MNKVKGHALILGTAALGAGLSLELIAASAPVPVRAGAALVTGATPAKPPVPSALKPVILEGAPLDRDQLARELQKELRRVGCYAGDVTGAWDPQSRQAMRLFTDKVQVRLPVEEPNHVLLKLVVEQQSTVCAAAAEPKLIAPPTEAKRPPSKRRREEAAAPPTRTGSMVPRSGSYAAPPAREAAAAGEAPPPRFMRALMRGVSGALSGLQWP